MQVKIFHTYTTLSLHYACYGLKIRASPHNILIVSKKALIILIHASLRIFRSLAYLSGERPQLLLAHIRTIITSVQKVSWSTEEPIWSYNASFPRLSRVFTWRGRNRRNQWKKCGKPNCGSATEDPGKLLPSVLDCNFGVTVNENLYDTIAFAQLNVSQTVSSLRTERNQRSGHDDDRSQPAESIPSLWGKKRALLNTHVALVLWCLVLLFRVGFFCVSHKFLSICMSEPRKFADLFRSTCNF